MTGSGDIQCNGNIRARVVEIDDVKEQFKKLRDTLIDRFTEDISTSCDSCIAKFYDRSLSSESSRTDRSGSLPIKEFRHRESLLTQMFETPSYRSILHIFIAIFFLFAINAIMQDVAEYGYVRIDFELIFWAFGNFYLVINTWVAMFASVLLVYPLFLFWAEHRTKSSITYWDWLWLSVFILFEFLIILIPCKLIISTGLPPASSMVLLSEQLRFMMKVHAFVRESVVTVISPKEKTDHEIEVISDQRPNFSAYLYFLFCPTLVYRNVYPRTKSTDWNYVVSNFGQVVICVFFLYYIFDRFCIPVFRDFTGKDVTGKALTMAVFSSMFPATMVLLLAFYGILHSWFNAFAEMLNFADRQFYRDWWNSTNFANYYRTWNIVVHDWLYSYIYRDSLRLMGYKKGSRPYGMAMVFLTSAIVHEYVISITLHFFYPVLFVLFAGCGFFMQFVKGKSRGWNVFLWMSLIVGNGLCMCLYSMEWFARQHCSARSSFDMVIPRSWSCNFQHLITPS